MSKPPVKALNLRERVSVVTHSDRVLEGEVLSVAAYGIRLERHSTSEEVDGEQVVLPWTSIEEVVIK